MALVFNVSLPLSACSSVSREAYVPLCDYMDVFLRALNATRVDAPIPAYGTGLYTSLSPSLHIAVFV
jgi:hypothetical protein